MKTPDEIENEKFQLFIEEHEARISRAQIPEGENACRAMCYWSLEDYRKLFIEVFKCSSIEQMARVLQRSRNSIESRLIKMRVISYEQQGRYFLYKWNRYINFYKLEIPKAFSIFQLMKELEKIGFIKSYNKKFLFINPNFGKNVESGKFLSTEERLKYKKGTYYE